MIEPIRHEAVHADDGDIWYRVLIGDQPICDVFPEDFGGDLSEAKQWAKTIALALRAITQRGGEDE